MYLIPCHLLTANELPSQELLSKYPRIDALFRPLCTAIKRGDLKGFDAALEASEPTFIKRRIYLTLERSHDIALRNVLRNVFLAGGYEPLKPGQTEADRTRRSRIPVTEFTAAVRLSSGAQDGEDINENEVECMLANMIYKVRARNLRFLSIGVVPWWRRCCLPRPEYGKQPAAFTICSARK